MATLNIKNLSEALYRRVQARARKNHRSVSQEVTHILEQVTAAPDELSILDLRGLGKERWRGIDAAKHVAEERKGWG